MFAEKRIKFLTFDEISFAPIDDTTITMEMMICILFKSKQSNIVGIYVGFIRIKTIM